MFNSFKSFIPKISTLFVLVLLFWAGWLFSFLMLIGIGVIHPEIAQNYLLVLVVNYIFAFGAPMTYAYFKGRKSLKNDPDCRVIPVDAPDYGKYSPVIWWVGSILVGSALVILALWITSFIPTKQSFGSYSALIDNVNVQMSAWDIIVSEFVIVPIFSSWLLCVVCVRGLTGNGFSIALALVAAFIAEFLENLDYSTLFMSLADVVCVGFIYHKTHSMKLAYVTMLVMCGIECLNSITHFIY